MNTLVIDKKKYVVMRQRDYDKVLGCFFCTG
jgi:hypothetical protein